MCSADAPMPQNNMVLSDNHQCNDALVSRITQLRQVLRDLRLALHLERLNLQREFQSTSCTNFQGQDRNWSQEDFLGNYKESFQPIQCYQFKIQEIQGFGEYDQDTTRWDSISDLEISKEKQIVPEFFDQNVSWATSMSTSNYYKQKIFDLENDCYAGLNKIKSKFMESLQGFEDTLDLVEICHEKKKRHTPGCQDKLNETNFETPKENFKREENILTCIYKPPARCKSLIDNKVQNNWPRNICNGRYSDSNICGLIYRSTQLLHEPTQIFDITDCISDFTLSKRQSPLFDPPDLSTLQASATLSALNLDNISSPLKIILPKKKDYGNQFYNGHLYS